ncbi:MAG: type II secretion system protein, partial [Haloferacaceae archaeon]
MNALATLAAAYPWPVDPDEELSRALGFLAADVSAPTVVRAGRVLGAATAALVAVVGALVASPWTAVTGPAVGAATLATARRAPRLL